MVRLIEEVTPEAMAEVDAKDEEESGEKEYQAS
jgi:hypothetical protein